MTAKKYMNNVDNDARHHYDVYELIGDDAFHIAPFTQEDEAKRVADALAALMLVEKDYQKFPKNMRPRYIVRARATVAHKIYEIDDRKLDRDVNSFNTFMETLKGESLLGIALNTIMPKESANEVIETLSKPKVKGKKKDKVAN